ncbi:conjugal transfer protein [Myceligenerans pegani]|uniref:Conjugal transfer protein n=1 Tax=Myceligenerans pegani TaxID=2776917 RepID=A0ABR9N1M0_9MICO|nr:conjugal transfer protein [Myceligenerans sp. TRM 65318]MBE1877534.1 conjugal transfer protein [Myceligenerans sp. TRM 65318]MBE3019805.1 conjugal transfer protein [Myceligenerans sp. TRM 65318]
MSSLLTGRRGKSNKKRTASPSALPAHPQRAAEDAGAPPSGNPWQVGGPTPSGNPARAAGDSAPPQVVEWSQGPALASKAWTALLVLALASGPVALVWAVLRPEPVPVASGTTSADQAASAAAAERAVELTETWLRADRDDQALVASLTEASVGTLPATGLTIRDSSVAAVAAGDPGPTGTTWMITVGVDVAEPAPGTTVPAADDGSGQDESSADGDGSGNGSGEASETTEPVLVWVRRYFQVPVTVQRPADEDEPLAVAALALPSPVPGPAAADAPGLDYPRTIATTSDAGESVAAFLGALVAGEGEITRYLRPGTTIQPVTPPPYTAVSVTSIGGSHEISDNPPDGDGTHALVTAELTRPDGEKTTAQYVLTLVARDGRWEVSGLDQAVRTETPVAGSGESGTE